MASCAAPRGGLSKETRPGAVRTVAAGKRRRGFLGVDPRFGGPMIEGSHLAEGGSGMGFIGPDGLLCDEGAQDEANFSPNNNSPASNGAPS
jgi:hypothetical protein